MSITGEPDGEPMKVGVGIADVMCGMYATVAVLARLRHRERTGEGQHIDLALLDTQVAWLVNEGMNYLLGQVPRRLGNEHPNIVPYKVFESATARDPGRRQRRPVPPLVPLRRRPTSSPPTRASPPTPCASGTGEALYALMPAYLAGARPRRPGSTGWQRWACPAARSTHRTRSSPTRRWWPAACGSTASASRVRHRPADRGPDQDERHAARLPPRATDPRPAHGRGAGRAA